MSQFEQSLFQYLENIKKQLSLKPLNLGGIPYSGGGYGQPPGGYIGYLPQTRVAYDLTEASNDGWVESGAVAEDGTVVSGTLLDNLNHIRYRVTCLEEGGNLEIQKDGIVVLSGVTIVNFEGDADVIPDGIGKVTVTVSGGSSSSLTVSISGVDIATNINTLDFENAAIVDNGDNSVTITCFGGEITGLTPGSVLFASATGKVTEDNNKFYWDDTNDILYLGDKSVPFTSSSILRLVKDGGTTGITALSYGSIPVWAGISSGGTKSAPTASADNSDLLWISGGGYDGADWYGAAYIKFIADETWAVGKHGTRMEFMVTNPGAVTTVNALELYNNTAIFPGTIKTNLTGTLDIAATRTVDIDANLTITTALTNNTGAGTLTWPAGGATLTIPATGTVDLLEAAQTITAEKTFTRTITNTSGQLIIGICYPITSSNGTYNDYGLSISNYGLVSTGVTNSGSYRGIQGYALRNSRAAGSDDSGTLATLAGLIFGVGHNNTNVSATPITTDCDAIRISLYGITGTIAYFKGLNIITTYLSGATGTEWAGINIGEMKAGATTTYGINVYKVSGTGTNNYGINIGDVSGATNNYALHTNTGNIVFNEGGNIDSDVRMESDTNINCFTLDAGNENITIKAASVSANYDLGLCGSGVLMLKETTTPTADTNYGKLYTKNDNKLYFQDGANAEHEISLVA